VATLTFHSARHCEERKRRSNPEALRVSFRDGPKDQTRNLEIPDRRFASSGMTGEVWISSRSLSSGAHSRDPLARKDGEGLGQVPKKVSHAALLLALRFSAELV
jgi:hypothetical protein